MRRSTGQATLEFLLLAGLVAVVALGLGVALASGAAASTADALRRALRPPEPRPRRHLGDRQLRPGARSSAATHRASCWSATSTATTPACRSTSPAAAAPVRALRRRPRRGLRPPRASPRRRVHPLLGLLPRLAHDAPARRRPRLAPRRLGGRDRPARRRRRGGPGDGPRRPRRRRAVVGDGTGLAADRRRGRSCTAPPGSHANGFARGEHRPRRRSLERHAGRGRPDVRRGRPGAVAAAAVRPVRRRRRG